MGMGRILLREVHWRLARGMTVIVTLVLIAYVTYDAIYIHFWFKPEDAVIVPIVLSTISVGGIVCHELIKWAQKRQLHVKAT